MRKIKKTVEGTEKGRHCFQHNGQTVYEWEQNLEEVSECMRREGGGGGRVDGSTWPWRYHNHHHPPSTTMTIMTTMTIAACVGQHLDQTTGGRHGQSLRRRRGIKLGRGVGRGVG